MEDFDMYVDENLEQENEKSPPKKAAQPSGIAMDALAGLLDSYSTGGVKNSPRSAPLQVQQIRPAATISTPIRSTTKTQVSTPSAATFQARTNKFENLVEHIGSKANQKSISQKPPQIQLQSTVKPYKYMYQTIYKRADALNKQLEQFEDLFISTNQEKTNFILYPIGNAVQDEVPLVGRIVCDSAGQLNAQSIILEGSSRTSKCNRVRLDVSSLPSYSFFPGQVVCVSGNYTSAECFHAKQLIDPPMIPRPIDTNISNDINFLIAAGPYLLANGDLSAFEELLRRADEDPAVQTLILLGPFVDERSSYIQHLKDKTYEQIFNEMIEKIQSFPTRTILIPSVRDIHHDSVYPLTPLIINNNQESSIVYSSEPSILSIDNLQCAITSTDVLCHLSSEEISFNQTTDRMSRLIRHLFHQRSFYPLIPSNESVSIEYEQSMSYARLDTLPHLFLTSSDLRPFVKFVDSVCAINIGRLVKNQDSTMINQTSGTYAKISLTKTDLHLDNDLNEHLHIQILRL